MSHFIYQYSIGLIVFSIGLFYAFKQGYVGVSNGKLKNLLALLVTFLFFFVLHGYLQFAPMTELDSVPYTGSETRKSTLGTPLDYGIMVAYFIMILIIGTRFSRRQKTLKDFFFGGQRFSWWLITFSLVATTIGSYSFVKYSRVAYTYGLGSSQTYFNDWMWLPLLLFGWLPIMYFSRLTSIPEYFEKRFDQQVRRWATAYILIYLIGYVGVNLFTMGKVLNILLGWPIIASAILVAAISAVYVTAGGQTSVIMTDLFQGIMLLTTGILILFLGINYLGGLEQFWGHLPRTHRLAFPNFNSDPSFPSVGIFWQDGMANTAMFFFLNQGFAMRFMSAKSMMDGRKAILVMVLVLMPVAAIVVASGGWVAKALVHAGMLPPNIRADEAFFVASEFLSKPGVFGLILATMTAALMSTVDTLITAIAAIVVNDVYQPIFNPNASERKLLKVARWSSVSVALLGVLLVPVFMSFKTIYEAHGAFTAAVTPPLVVTLLFSVFWRRYTRKAALYTLIGGMGAIVLSLFLPEIISPFAHGVPIKSSGDSIFSGMSQYKFMRAFYGLSISTGIGLITTFFTSPEPFEKQNGYVWGTIEKALERYKGSAGQERKSQYDFALPVTLDEEITRTGAHQLPLVSISQSLADGLNAKNSDLVYITDNRWWLGGLNSTHAIIEGIETGNQNLIFLGQDIHTQIVAKNREKSPLRIEKLY